MKTYKIVVSYDGTDYYGWQIQPDKVTISHILEKQFKAVFKKNIKIIGASRTDSGVHALGQVAKFETDINIKPEILIKAWNNLLPSNILIRSIELVNSDFHPRAKVKQKTYYYNFTTKKAIPLISNYVYSLKSYRHAIDFDKLKVALNIFVGTHDFRSFCTGYEQESTIRTIDSISLVYLKRYKIYQIQVKGKSFLRYMIRRIVGACLEIANSKKRHINELKIALEKPNPEQNLFTAPANGLILRKIIYF